MLAILTLGCGNPAAPEGALPLAAVTYSLTAGAISQLCRDLTQPQVVRYITVRVALSLEGTTWIGRPLTSESGSFELRLERGTGPEAFGAVPLVGTLTGRLQDLGVPPLDPPSGVQLAPVQAAATVPMSGAAAVTGSTASGRFEAALAFSSAARSMTCPAESLSWALIRN
jgi:hypothetical protein